MSSYQRNLEERIGLNLAHYKGICAVFHWTIRTVSFISVQRFLARTSRHPLDVRSHPLTPYVQTPFGRTATEPTPYVHRIFRRGIWRFVFFGRYFFTLQNSRICRRGWFLLLLSHSQGVCEYQNESRIQKNHIYMTPVNITYGRKGLGDRFFWHSFWPKR